MWKILSLPLINGCQSCSDETVQLEVFTGICVNLPNTRKFCIISQRFKRSGLMTADLAIFVYPLV